MATDTRMAAATVKTSSSVSRQVLSRGPSSLLPLPPSPLPPLPSSALSAGAAGGPAGASGGGGLLPRAGAVGSPSRASGDGGLPPGPARAPQKCLCLHAGFGPGLLLPGLSLTSKPVKWLPDHHADWFAAQGADGNGCSTAKQHLNCVQQGPRASAPLKHCCSKANLASLVTATLRRHAEHVCMAAESKGRLFNYHRTLLVSSYNAISSYPVHSNAHAGHNYCTVCKLASFIASATHAVPWRRRNGCPHPG